MAQQPTTARHRGGAGAPGQLGARAGILASRGRVGRGMSEPDPLIYAGLSERRGAREFMCGGRFAVDVFRGTVFVGCRFIILINPSVPAHLLNGRFGPRSPRQIAPKRHQK